MRQVARTVVAGVLLAACVASFRVQAGSDTASGDVQLQLGNILYSEARYNEALAAYDEALKSENPTISVQARAGVVQTSLRVAEFGRARTEAETLIKSKPRDASTRALYGDSLWAVGLFEESEEAFKDALSMDPESSRARHGFARALAARSQLDQAMNEAQAALRLSPRDFEIHHTVGSIYERMHQFEQAAVAFGNYVNLLPNKDRSEIAIWSRAEVRFLKSFGERTPFEITDANASMLHTVPFKLVDDKVVVQARVNGGPEMDFILDTGSEQTVVSRRTAARLGVTPIVYTLSAGVGEVGLRGLQLARLDSFEVGTFKMKNVPCLIKNPPLQGMPTREAESFSPLALGFSMLVDYGRRELTIGRTIPEEQADVELPLRMHRLAMVRGTLDGSLPASFVVDTGGEVISISTDTATALGRDPQDRKIPLKVYGTSGWDRDAFLMPSVDLAFSAITFRRMPIVVLNLRVPSILLGFQVGGIVGHKFLSHYRVGIDLERSVLRLKSIDARAAANN